MTKSLMRRESYKIGKVDSDSLIEKMCEPAQKRVDCRADQQGSVVGGGAFPDILTNEPSLFIYSGIRKFIPQESVSVYYVL